MTSLGNLGQAKTQNAGEQFDTFGWFGATLRINNLVDDIELIDLLESSRQIDSRSLEAMVLVKDSLRVLIHRDDFDEFWSLARANRQDVDDLTATFMVLMEGTTGRPTQQPSDSSDGRLPTTENSPVDSSLQASAGRPDLQLLRDEAAATQKRLLQAVTA